MPLYLYKYTVEMRNTVTATSVTEAAALARRRLADLRDSRLVSVEQIDPPLKSVEPVRPPEPPAAA